MTELRWLGLQHERAAAVKMPTQESLARMDYGLGVSDDGYAYRARINGGCICQSPVSMNLFSTFIVQTGLRGKIKKH